MISNRPLPSYAVATIAQALDTSGRLGGAITESGTPLKEAKITIHWRSSGRCIGIAYTDANGDWEIGGFDPSRSADYAVWIRDKDGGTVYNDVIYALVAPTP